MAMSEREPPADNIIIKIMAASRPLSTLKEHCEKTPAQRLQSQTAVELKTKTLSSDPGECWAGILALEERLLPTLCTLFSKFKGLGVDEEALFEKGMTIVEREITRWDPYVGEGRKGLGLAFNILVNGERSLRSFIVRQYGMPGAWFPLVRRYFETRKAFREDFGREAEEEDIEVLLEEAENLGLGREYGKRKDKARKYFKNIHYLYVENTLGSRLEEIDVICDPEKIVEIVEFENLKKDLSENLERLNSRERIVIERYYGFIGEEETLEEIGRRYGVTQERIRQILAKALRRLSHPYFSYRLKNYLFES